MGVLKKGPSPFSIAILKAAPFGALGRRPPHPCRKPLEPRIFPKISMIGSWNSNLTIPVLTSPSQSGWPARMVGPSKYTDRVIEEYRKFLYLLASAGHPVTPSDQVDQAWHLHLTYTRSYWEDLCEKTIGKPLHHGPTKGGAE